MNLLIVLVLVAAALFLVWKSWDPATKTLNWSGGIAALVALAAAAWSWVHDLGASLLSNM